MLSISTGQKQELLAAAEKIGKVAEAEAYEADQNGIFSNKVIDAIVEGNINKLLIPKRYGGPDVDLRTYTEVIRTVAKHSPAAAWLTYLYAIHNVWVSHLPTKGREEIFNQGGLLADILAPVGKVEEEGDGYLISGKWDFTSGVSYSDWVAVGALKKSPDDGTPELCLFTLKTSEIEIVDNWDTFGLRATGSQQVVANRIFVPEERVVRVFKAALTGKPVVDDYDEDELVYQVPFLTLFYIGFPFVALGGAERLLHEFTERTKKRMRIYEGGTPERKEARSQRVLAELKTDLAAADGLMEKYINMLEEYQKGEELTNEGPEHFFALRAQAIKICADLASKVFLCSGGNAIYKGNPIELFTRDIMTVAVHPTSLYEDALAAYGQTLFNFKPVIPKF